MHNVVQPIDDIFWQAAQLEPGEQRDAYLARACGEDQALRQRVERLLQVQPKLDEFLERPFSAPGQLPTVDASPMVEQPGTLIGPYKLLEQIGEGGMGLVFMADQLQPVRRRVALKVLKPGMDTRQVVARFEAERQALALMDHPHIAKIHDGGTTASGRPYFVMELVRGVPITDFCDQRRLTTRQRLELFATVCQAVQHAHHKGIIHRDLKPSNVLVTLHDTVAVPKVIDFGIAKATGQQLTERTLFTHFAQMVGTPLYMSPEQAEMNSLDVDTRSDVYSLGVLLYELLTGTTPFASATLKQVGLDEMRRMIREEEPPTPSQRLRTLGAEAGAMFGLAQAYRHAGQWDISVPLWEQLLDKRRTICGPTHPDTLGTMHLLAMDYTDVGRFKDSMALHAKVLDGLNSTYGPKHDSKIWPMLTFAQVCQRAGELERADQLLREALDQIRKQKDSLGQRNGKANALGWLALNLLLQERYGDAERIAREAIAIDQIEKYRHFYWMSVLGAALLGQKKYADAEPLLLQGYGGMKQWEVGQPAGGRRLLVDAGERVVRFYQVTGQPEKARAWCEKLSAEKHPR
jgi:serine/threonine protein kinase